MLNLDNFYEIYKSFITFSGVKYSLYVAKALAVVIILIHYFKIYFKAYHVQESSHSAKFSYYELFRPLIIVLLVAGYTTLTDNIDKIAVAAETYMSTNLKNETTVVKALDNKNTQETKKPPEQPKQSNLDRMASAISKIGDLFTYPSVIMVKIMDFITSLIDAFIYGFVCCTRFAFIFILRFLGPFALVASIYDRFQHYFWNWLKAYGIVYLWVFVIFLINLFCALFARGIYNLKYAVNPPAVNAVIDTAYSTGAEINANFAYSMALSFMVLVKLYLYLKSKKILERIFN